MRTSNYITVTAEPVLFSEVFNTFRRKMHQLYVGTVQYYKAVIRSEADSLCAKTASQ